MYTVPAARARRLAVGARLERGVRLRRFVVDAANRSEGRLAPGFEASGLLPADSLGHRVGNPCDSFGPCLDTSGGGFNTNLDTVFGCFGAALDAAGRSLGPTLDCIPDFGGDSSRQLGSWRGRLTRKCRCSEAGDGERDQDETHFLSLVHVLLRETW